MDHAEALGLHLEVAVRSQLGRFVGISEIEYEIGRWAASGDEERVELVERVLAGGRGVPGLLRLVRRLVREQVPIDPLDPVLSAYADAPGADVVTLVEEARRGLARALSGRSFRRETVVLDEDLERELAQWVRHVGRTRVLAVPEQEAERVGDAVEAHVNAHGSERMALVVRDADVRPFAQRVMETRKRPVLVLSQSELEALVGTPAEGRRAPVESA
jgi:type III secretory pathway component EscV